MPSLRAASLTTIVTGLLALLVIPMVSAAPPTPTADLSLTKAASSDPVVAGSDVVYYLNVSNAGPSTAAAVTVVDTLPSSFTFVSASSGCTSNAAQHTVTCNVGAVISGSTASRTITATVSSTPGNYTDNATVSSSTSDTNTANNAASFTTHVVTAAPTGVTCGPTLSGVHVEWDAVSGAVSYNVYRSTGGGSYIFLANTGTTSYDDTSAAPGQLYSYEVTAVSAGGESATSASCTSVAVPMFPGTFALVAAILGSALAVGLVMRRRT